MDAGHREQEQEVRAAVEGRLTQVPDDPVTVGQVLRVAQQHGRVLLRPSPQVDPGPDVPGQGEQEEKEKGDVRASDAAGAVGGWSRHAAG